ncbi:hypothetical protein ADUPG1_000774 [Aduncisulcus paluster]|uniref:Uncharacterized protein n=1 Tax=Aduncisulcus paluster TaxID=2918883 RepID=A0ABQ5K7W7_9EUKA|nr:hypothetical protein ADUPG1_000774 [Aduncisulcus paluster]
MPSIYESFSQSKTFNWKFIVGGLAVIGVLSYANHKLDREIEELKAEKAKRDEMEKSFFGRIKKSLNLLQ